MLERFVNGRNKSNAYVFARSDGRALLVDAGVGAATKVVDLVRAERLDPLALFLTHGHPDHIWTARQLADRYDIPAYVHLNDLPWFFDPASGKTIPAVRKVGSALARLKRLRPARLRAISDQATIGAGPFRVSVLHAPGHSRGSVCLRVDDLCFVGDTVFRDAVGHGAFPGGSTASLRNSIKRVLLPLPDDVRILPGHGEETLVGAERKRWVDYTSDRGA